MRIRVERSGGLTGIPKCTEIDTKDLPATLVSAAKKIMAEQRLSSLTMKATPRGAADHYVYKISIQDGVNRSVIECNQYNIQDDLKSLVKYIETNSMKRK